MGGILNLGETREQRVEMAFELAAINPTSVPINLLNPRPGTKFGDRELMDPWEVVKWIAIFRLILPEALFRLCGGRVENLGELQATAVRAGLNGVMMGNFLTTLGNTPDEDRAMFEDLGLNVAPPGGQRRQPPARQPLRVAGGRDPGCRRRRAGGADVRLGPSLRSGCGIHPRSCASPPSARCPRGPTGRPIAVAAGNARGGRPARPRGLTPTA